MAATRNRQRPEADPSDGVHLRRRLAIEAGMIALLGGLALLFLIGAPS